MSGTIHYYPVKILEKYLDTFGHVNNAVYLELFEEARWDYVTAGGYGMGEIVAHHQGPIILEVHLKFRKELLLREEIVIETQCTEYRKRIGKIVQYMRNSRGEVAAQGEFTFGLFDTVERKLIPPTPAWLKAVGLLPEASGGEPFPN